MALAVTSKTSAYNNANQTSYNTASVSFTANALAVVIVHTPATQAGGSPAAPTLSGGGMTTWTSVAGYLYDDTGAVRGRIDVFRSLQASPGASAAITIDYAGVQQAGCAHSVFEVTGVDTSGTNGAGAIVQAVTGTLNPSATTTPSLSLAALGSANNGAFGGFAHQANEVTTHGSGFTEIHDVQGGTPSVALQSEFRLNVTTVDASWATSSVWGGIAFEVKAASAGTSVDLTHASETDTAQALTFVKTIFKTLTAATESDAAQILSVTKTILKSITPAVETDTSVALSLAKRLSLTVVSESDAAQALSYELADGTQRITITAATEADAAQALVAVKTIYKTLTPAAELEVAQTLSIEGGVAVTVVVRPPIVIGRF